MGQPGEVTFDCLLINNIIIILYILENSKKSIRSLLVTENLSCIFVYNLWYFVCESSFYENVNIKLSGHHAFLKNLLSSMLKIKDWKTKIIKYL